MRVANGLAAIVAVIAAGFVAAFAAAPALAAPVPMSPDWAKSAMFLHRLGFEGPKLEAMRDIDPFASFLLLVGEVESDAASCPAQ